MSVRTLFSVTGLHVLAVDTPKTAIRTEARRLVRAALRETLARLLAVSDAAIPLLSVPGAPLRLALPWAHIGLSVSHEAGLSLAAISFDGEVGVDLLRLAAPFPELEQMARDYLGPAAAQTLIALPPERRPEAFARAWARHEAALNSCTLTDLAMENGLIAALASRKPGL